MLERKIFMNKQSTSTPPAHTRNVLQAPGSRAEIKGLGSRQAGLSVRKREDGGKGKQISRVSVADRGPLSPELLRKMDAYWRAANYLSVGQIYLYDNTLLKKPLKREHIKPRLLGHWGTTPGLNFIYVHLNRIIKERDLNLKPWLD